MRTRPLGAVLLSSVVLLSACSAETNVTSEEALQEQTQWTDRMRLVLEDPDGLGTSSGGVPGSIDVRAPEGDAWVLYAACKNADVLRLQVTSGSTTLAATDMACGATLRIPITTDPAEHLRVRVTRVDESKELASWLVAINRPTWTQDNTFTLE